MLRFSFIGQYAIAQGLPYRIALNYPGDWSAAIFVGQIRNSAGGLLASWSFAAGVYDSVADHTEIQFFLSGTTTGAIPVNVGGILYEFDVVGELPDQDPIIIMAGLATVTGVVSDLGLLAGGAGSPLTPTLVLQARISNQITILGQGGFSSALIGAAITAHNANPFAHPGLIGGSGLISYSATAGQSLSALRVICLVADQFVYADANNPEHSGLPLWFLIQASPSGDIATGFDSGLYIDQSWDWTPDPIWLGIDGTLTQTPSLSWEFLRQIGEAVNPDRLLFNPRGVLNL